MICSDISKASTLRLQCINLAKKSGVNDGNNEYSKYIDSIGRGDVNVGFLGFVSMHFNGKKSESRMLRSFTIQSFVLFIDKPSHTKVIVAHTSASLYDTTIVARLLQILN